jgi:hypothetical protein
VELWFEEAKANNVLPLSDLGATGPELEKRLSLEYHVPVPNYGPYTYYPGTTEVPEHSAANTQPSRSRSSPRSSSPGPARA